MSAEEGAHAAAAAASAAAARAAPARHAAPHLYPAERAAAPMAACVVGASGFLGSHVVARLLAGGHTVHATTRNLTDARAAHLRALPGAAERLRVFEADAAAAGALDAAAAGCRALFLCAGPVAMQVTKAEAHEALVAPYLALTEAALGAATAAGVEVVVYTSSVAACTAGNEERGRGHVMTEADWAINVCFVAAAGFYCWRRCRRRCWLCGLTASLIRPPALSSPPFLSSPQAAPDYLAFNYAKKVAEQRAWALHAAQAGPRRWRLAALLPSLMLGPPVGPTASQSAAFCADVLAGKFVRAMPPLGFCVVDVRDVAAAAALAAALPLASGRFLLSESSVNVIDLIKAVGFF
jgi:nucleoside-diphosphate-sugar epimerase